MPRMLLISSALLLCLLVDFAPALARQRDGDASSSAVIAVRSERGVRFTSPAASEIRLELFSETGERVFDSEYRRGGVLDWSAADHPLYDGSYLFVVTVRDVSGRLRQRHATAHVQSGQPVLVRSGRSKFTAAQTRAWEASRAAQSLAPATGDEHVIVLSEEDVRSLVVSTHDGADGHVTSTAGALTFRTGDVLAGRDQERMRITPDGKVGVGTSEPQTALDVEGEVRATEGIRFGDGTTLSSRDGKLVARDASGEPLPGPSAAGTGTQNHVAKWAETGGAGTLTNSTLFESGGNVGIGTTNPASMLHLAGPNGVAAITFNTPGTQKFRFQSIPFIVDWGALTLNSNYDGTTGWFLDDPSREGWFFKLDGRPGDFLGVPNRGLWLYRIPPGAGAHTDESPVFGVSTDRAFFAGNVGVGKASPAEKLDVVGNINATGEYRINGSRALAVTGTTFAPDSNTFVGVLAGTDNTTGSFNSFFGNSAGRFNTTGIGNSFFGYSAGLRNLTGGSNSFFGYSAGFNNSTGGGNSFFGYFAGQGNTTGGSNAFFGMSAGHSNTTGSGNSFFGRDAGRTNNQGFNNSFFGNEAGFSNTQGISNAFFGVNAGRATVTGSGNAFFGLAAGLSNISGGNNSYFGSFADGADALTNAAAIGHRAFVTQSNSLVLGSISGVNAASADTKVGIGTTAPANPLHVVGAGTTSGGCCGATPYSLEVVGHFIQPSDTNHSAFSIDASGATGGQPSGRDSILYFSKGGTAMWGIRNDADVGDKLQFRYHGGGGATEVNSRLTIQPDGNVGIGTNSPARKLHISDAMRLQPIASPPASPASGDMYFDTSEALCVFVNGAWAKLAGPGTCQ